MLDIDPIRGQFEGTGYVFCKDNSLPNIAFTVILKDSDAPQEFESRIFPFADLRVISNDYLKARYSMDPLPQSLNGVASILTVNSLNLEWALENERISIALARTVIPETSIIAADPEVRTWSDFREMVFQNDFRKLIFRGQPRPYPLQTSFHRTRRKQLTRFRSEDVESLHRSLTGKTKHIFDLEKPQELGAFLNLAQHHGFPTPLLDWTYSPFVAAWFAFMGRRSSKQSISDDDIPTRVFSLDLEAFRNFNQFQSLNFAPPHFSILEALAIENDRAIPQQGLLTLTNMHDIEAYLELLEIQSGTALLKAYDIPSRYGAEALDDLAMMGINRATLMPSIESICLDLRDRYF